MLRRYWPPLASITDRGSLKGEFRSGGGFLTQEEALRAYARMINTGELGHLAPLLAQNFRLTSQNVLRGFGVEG